MEIEVEKITVPDNFIRSEGEAWKNLEQLAASIREVGLIHPIKVAPKDDGYELVVGYRRLLAVRDLLKRPTIRAEVVEEPMDETEKVRIAFIENIRRKPLIDREMIDAAVRLYRSYGHYTDVADKLCIDYDFARDLVGLEGAPEELVKMVGRGRGRIGRDKAIEILKAYQDNPERAVEIAKLYVAPGVTKEERERLIEIVKEKSDQPTTLIKKEMSKPRKRYEFPVVLPVTYYKRFEKACEAREMEPPELAKTILMKWIDENAPA